MSLFRKKPADDASGFPSTFLRHAGSLCLDGTWLIKDETPGEGTERRNFDGDRENHGWLPATVPCSVQTALLERNRIPDPYTGRSNLDCLWMEEREWWFKKRFVLPHDWGGSNVLLAFDGVDYWGEFWLNGHPLGFHEGMFGGPFFVVTDLLAPGQENNLTVKLDPAPRNWRHHLKNSVSYGWHYGRYVTAGIWQSVHLIRCAAVLIENVDAVPLKVRSDEALMEIRAEIWCFEKSLRGELSGEIRGKGFDRTHPLKERVCLHFGRNFFRFRTRLSDPRFWWPFSHGSPNLYACTMQVCAVRVRAVGVRAMRVRAVGVRAMRLRSIPASEKAAPRKPLDQVSFTFGIKTVEKVAAVGKKRGEYDWIFRINGQKVFIKGANWCFLDALLRFPEARYRRVLAMAKEAGINLLRVWGGGIVETRCFYDLCDEMGIMVWQEFPLTHPVSVGRNGPPGVSLDVLREQARHILERLRTRASLALWGGGNEHGGRGEAVDLLEKLCRRLDPAKPFHRASPYGGDSHDWDVYHRYCAVTDYTKNPTPFLSEFGLPCPPRMESLHRFIPPEERTEWPPRYGGSFLHHVPEYGASPDMVKMLRYAGQYGDIESVETFVRYMQLSQAVALRTGIEHMLAGMLDSTGGVLIYKLGENTPGISWSVIDWFGLAKPGYSFVKRAYEPVHIFCRYQQSVWFAGTDFRAHVLAALGRRSGPCRVQAAIYGSELLPLHEEEHPLPSLSQGVHRVMSLCWQVPPRGAAPFFLQLRLIDQSGSCVSENVYWYNFDNSLAHQTSWRSPFDDFSARIGCLDRLPRTSLSVQSSPSDPDGSGGRGGIRLLVENRGGFPSFLTSLSCRRSDGSSAESSVRYGDNDFWLPKGEKRPVTIALDEPVPGDLIVRARSWNAPAVESTVNRPSGGIAREGRP